LIVRVDFHPGATADLDSSADWYLERSPAAAREFAIAIDDGLDKIAADPQRFVFWTNAIRPAA
jgi:plasmid stabilization system protein ParE